MPLTRILSILQIFFILNSAQAQQNTSLLQTGIYSSEDLAPLGAILKDADIVALGESTHMSGGYHRVRFRVIKYLVENFGVRAITFETPWRQALPATNYISKGQSSIEDALN